MTISEWLNGLEDERERIPYDADELHEAAAFAVRGVPRERLPLRLSKHRIEALSSCPRRALAEAANPPDSSGELFLIGRLVERAARMHLWGRYPAGDPGALRQALIEHSLARGEELPELDDMVWESISLRADRFARSWGASAPALDVHVGERLVVPLAIDPQGHAGVVLTGVTDISIGTHVSTDPHRPRAVLELKSGRTPWNPLNESLWYQFMVSAADGFAPHRVGLWAAAPDTNHQFGDVVDSPVNAGSIDTATRRVCEALVVVGGIAAGEKPEERPSVLCRRCPDRHTCPSAHVGLALAHRPGWDDDNDDALDDTDGLDGTA